MGLIGSIVRFFDGRDPEPASAAPFEPRADESLLRHGLAFKGEISGDGSLLILGDFDGEIHVAGTVRVGADARVDANISAAAVVIAGAVRGNVSATTRVEMLPTGTLTGSVKSGSLLATEGALLRGEVWIEPAVSAAPSTSAPR